MLRRRYLVVVPVLVAWASGSAHAVVICARKDANGAFREGAALHLRAACKVSEAPLPVSFEDGGQTVRFTGVNVQIVNGAGESNDVNGRGNLIVGYNEDDVPPLDRSGSHNLVLGQGNSYTSYGGLVGGIENTISGPESVAFGFDNEASGQHAFVLGGFLNTASGIGAVVAGGESNTASATSSVASGGQQNIANGFRAWVGGGGQNHASGSSASVAGGVNNTASGTGTSIVGGAANVASGTNAAVSGGFLNQAIGDFASIGGGRSNQVTGANATVSGGTGVAQSTADGWAAGTFSSP